MRRPMQQIFYCDGTVTGLSRGWYWRRQVGGAGHFGAYHGPFETSDDAFEDAGITPHPEIAPGREE